MARGLGQDAAGRQLGHPAARRRLKELLAGLSRQRPDEQLREPVQRLRALLAGAQPEDHPDLVCQQPPGHEGEQLQ